MHSFKKNRMAIAGLGYAMLLVALATGCTPAPGASTAAPLTPTQPILIEATSISPSAAATIPGGTGSATPLPAQTEIQPAASQVPPRTDPEPLSPAEVARSALAGRLGVEPGLVSVVSEGDWTAEPIRCQLDLPGERVDQLLQGEHKQIILSFKNILYEYWAFQSVGGVAMAFACLTPA